MVLLGAIDQGTSSSRFLVFNPENGELVASHQIEVRQIFPQAGWVEMDPNEIYETVMTCINQTCAKLKATDISPGKIAAIGIANQRETTIVWDKETGKPLYNAIVWLDTRTATIAEEAIEKTSDMSKDSFKAKTGLPIHPYFSALKIKWLLDNVPDVQAALKTGNLLFGTVDSWLIYKLTGLHVTDVTNASRTLLLDLSKRKWSTQLCSFFDIPTEILPPIKSSAEIYGYLREGPLKGVPISGCLGDQQAALVGHSCFKQGDTKSTYGTGTFMLCNTGTTRLQSKHGLLTTVAFQFGYHQPVCYALEGSGSIGGNVVRFLRDNLGFINHPADVEKLAGTVADTNDVYFVPCFAGLYTPHWDSTARGTICGLTQCSTKAHIARAALKAVAFQTTEMIEAIETDLGRKVPMLRLDGGMTANKLFNQIQADTLGRPVVVSRMAEISGWGAAIAAGIGSSHICSDSFAVKSNNICKRVQYNPIIPQTQRDHELTQWKRAVERAREWIPVNDHDSEHNNNSSKEDA